MGKIIDSQNRLQLDMFWRETRWRETGNVITLEGDNLEGNNEYNVGGKQVLEEN